MSISSRLSKHFTLCAAAVATVAVVSTTNAAVIYSGVMNLNVPFSTSFLAGGLYMNVETGATGTTAGAAAGWDVRPYGGSTTSVGFISATGSGYMRNPGTGTLINRTNIDSGTAIGSAAFFDGRASAVIGVNVGQWTANTTGIFGFKFIAADALTHYGWMRLAIGATTATRSIVDWGYESTAGAEIAAGAVPAPGALALLGLAGLATRRRRA